MTLLETIRALDAPYVVWLTRAELTEYIEQYRGLLQKYYESPLYPHSPPPAMRVEIRCSEPPEPLATPEEIDAALGVLT